MLTHFDHLSKLSLFFIKSCILFLLLSKLRCRVKEELKVMRVTPILEQIDLRQQLLFLLFKLSDFLF